MTTKFSDYSIDSLNIGFSKQFTITITESMMTGFAEISGDHNPVHTDLEFANTKGFDGQVVYGGLLIALISRMIGMHLPGRNALWNNLNITFLRPVYIGQIVTINAEVSHISTATSSIELKFKIVVNEKIVARATAGVMVQANND